MSATLYTILLIVASACITFKSTAAIPSEVSPKPEVCEDKDPDCPFYAEICDESYIVPFVSEQCQKTCGYCIPTDVQECSDADSDCPGKSYTCNIKSYNSYNEIMCRKTCGYCTYELDNNDVI
ncbi:uncharacterized protein [Antedon mediterranea]|uniref:uncharacterized protein n=1 Tax=Antedon mediterranea TaxID=105859 RepID=UPI003AF973F7